MSVINTAPTPEPHKGRSDLPPNGATRRATVTAVLIAAGIIAIMLITFAIGRNVMAAMPIDSAGGTVWFVASAVVGQFEGALSVSYRVPSHGTFPELDAREIPNGVIDDNDNIERGLAPDGGTGEGVNDRRSSIATPRGPEAIGIPTTILTSTIDLGIWPYPRVHGDAVEGGGQTQVGVGDEGSE